ncbi:MAG: acetaldehyde dehydrogenase (acetylating) [Lachnospiraceae bacterium]|nr:acetaldehyde dehydrogenase (acetylating) [Lachnospiraceae bacterium]
MDKVKVGIIGTGNIGSDLLMKVRKSDVLECGIFAGHSLDSKGIARAREMGVPVTVDSIRYIEENPDCCEIVFDATSAKVHAANAPILKKLGKYAIDLTPAHVGKFCVPQVNLDEALGLDNVNCITCGGQATVPIARAISQVADIDYLEIVATIASKSAGIGTRNNIDEFTQTTKDALMELGGIKNAKAIIILNPAEPPITMHNTVYALIDHPDMDAITKVVRETETEIRKYVPGYRIVLGPIYENGRVTTSVEVTGSGDFLPEYAGNLDIITCAAVEIAENYARRKLL